MWIEVDFDERIFRDHVWNDFFRSARSLRHVLGNELERVRITGQLVTVEGEPTKVIRFAVTLRVRHDPTTLTFEFASGGRWRMRTGEEDPPFNVLMPEAKHDYERDVLLRSELQIGLLQNQVRRWAELQRGSDRPAAG